MKILIATDGSKYTRRMLAYIVAHDEWFAEHAYTVIYSVPLVPHRAAAFAGADLVRAYYDDDAEAVFRPIRAFFESKAYTPALSARSALRQTTSPSSPDAASSTC